MAIQQVVHIAAIPDIEHNSPHTIFANNTTATFNVVEACVQLNVPRLINISSEQVRVRVRVRVRVIRNVG